MLFANAQCLRVHQILALRLRFLQIYVVLGSLFKIVATFMRACRLRLYTCQIVGRKSVENAEFGACLRILLNKIEQNQFLLQRLFHFQFNFDICTQFLQSLVNNNLLVKKHIGFEVCLTGILRLNQLSVQPIFCLCHLQLPWKQSLLTNSTLSKRFNLCVLTEGCCHMSILGKFGGKFGWFVARFVRREGSFCVNDALPEWIEEHFMFASEINDMIALIQRQIAHNEVN